MQTTLYLARHGETQWNKRERFQGQLDSELTELGKQQSQQLAQALSGCAIDTIVCSPLGRAKATATICQRHLNVSFSINAQLSERNLGHWQGHYLHTLANQPEYHEMLQQFTFLAPLNGESAVACGQRIYQAIQKIAQSLPNKKVLIVFHGEALRCFLLQLGQQHSGNAYQLFTNGSICQLHYLHASNEFHPALEKSSA